MNQGGLGGFGIQTAKKTEIASVMTPVKPIDWEAIAARESRINALKASDPDMSAKEAFRKTKYGEKSTLANAFTITQLAIAILMSLYLVMNWFRRNKGEPQHQDALMKVFGGGLASLLILQCLKAIFLPTL